jgi:hypothetical protein
MVASHHNSEIMELAIIVDNLIRKMITPQIPWQPAELTTDEF